MKTPESFHKQKSAVEKTEQALTPKISEKNSAEQHELAPEVLEQLGKEADELLKITQEIEETPKEPGLFEKLRKKFKKSATVLMLSLSLFAAGGTFEKAQAGSQVDFGRIVTDVLRGVSRGASRGASRTMERILTGGEDQLKYERQRDKIFNQYLQMMRRNPAMAERFLHQSMENLNRMYGRY